MDNGGDCFQGFWRGLHLGRTLRDARLALIEVKRDILAPGENERRDPAFANHKAWITPLKDYSAQIWERLRTYKNTHFVFVNYALMMQTSLNRAAVYGYPVSSEARGVQGRDRIQFS